MKAWNQSQNFTLMIKGVEFDSTSFDFIRMVPVFYRTNKGYVLSLNYAYDKILNVKFLRIDSQTTTLKRKQNVDVTWEMYTILKF